MIRFGTDGWRAIIGGDFTLANVHLFATGVARWLAEIGGCEAGVIVGYDNRFMSDEFPRLCAAVLAGAGVRARLCTGPAPTPAVAWAARQLGAAAALIVTASHNPYQYNGIKLRGREGTPLSETAQDRVAAIITELGRSPAARAAAERAGRAGLGPAAGRTHAAYEQFDPWPGYAGRLSGLIEPAALRSLPSRVLHDAMHGSAGGWLARLVPGLRTIRGGRDATFGGAAPEPLPANLAGLAGAVRDGAGAALGLATDGDGDRLAAVAEDGSYVDAHHLLALLFVHLVEVRGLRGRAVRTVTTSTLIDRLAAAYGLPVEVTPVGFRHVASRLADRGDGPAVIGGEESGGIGVPLHLAERDGIFAALLLLEHLGGQRVSLGEALAGLRRRAGRLCLGRADIRLAGRPGRPWLERRVAPPPGILGEPLAGWRYFDGLHLRLRDGAWLHLRASRTEPVLRVYAEAGSSTRLAALLAAGRRLLTAGDPSPPGGGVASTV